MIWKFFIFYCWSLISLEYVGCVGIVYVDLRVNFVLYVNLFILMIFNWLFVISFFDVLGYFEVGLMVILGNWYFLRWFFWRFCIYLNCGFESWF